MNNSRTIQIVNILKEGGHIEEYQEYIKLYDHTGTRLEISPGEFNVLLAKRLVYPNSVKDGALVYRIPGFLI